MGESLEIIFHVFLTCFLSYLSWKDIGHCDYHIKFKKNPKGYWRLNAKNGKKEDLTLQHYQWVMVRWGLRYIIYL